jgi:hypothetical protein
MQRVDPGGRCLFVDQTLCPLVHDRLGLRPGIASALDAGGGDAGADSVSAAAPFVLREGLRNRRGCGVNRYLCLVRAVCATD